MSCITVSSLHPRTLPQAFESQAELCLHIRHHTRSHRSAHCALNAHQGNLSLITSHLLPRSFEQRNSRQSLANSKQATREATQGQIGLCLASGLCNPESLFCCCFLFLPFLCDRCSDHRRNLIAGEEGSHQLRVTPVHLPGGCCSPVHVQPICIVTLHSSSPSFFQRQDDDGASTFPNGNFPSTIVAIMDCRMV